jgi:prophage regulatory protein
MRNSVAATKLLTYSDLTSILNRNYKTIWAWVRDGDFPQPIKLKGKTIGWRQEDFEKWMSENHG